MKTCGLHRFFLSWRSDGRNDWPKFTEKHLKECADCRNWWQEQRGLEARLSERPRDLEVSPGFTRGVMWQIESAVPELKPTSSLGWRLAAAAGLGMVCVMLFREPGRDVTQATIERNNAPEFAEVQMLVKKNAEVLKLLPERVDDPLEKELQFVISDTKNAFAFVADSVLPEDFRRRQ